jgi:hypothetical protein
MMEDDEKKTRVRTKITKLLADVPVDNREERDELHARLRRRYAELKPLKFGMSKVDLDRFEEIGEINDLLEKSEARSRAPRC